MYTANLILTHLWKRCYNFYCSPGEPAAQRIEVTDPRSYDTDERQSLNWKPVSLALESAIESLFHATFNLRWVKKG